MDTRSEQSCHNSDGYILLQTRYPSRAFSQKEMHHNTYEARPERMELGWVFNPSIPATESELESFIDEAAHILTDSLATLESERRALPC